MKKKVIKSTVAAALAFSTVAGLPLSSKGLQEAIGVPTAYAAYTPIPLPASATNLIQRLTDAYAQLTVSEKEAIKQARLAFLDQNNFNSALVDPIVEILNNKGAQITSAQTLSNMMFFTSMLFTTDRAQLEQHLDMFRQDGQIRTYFALMAAPAGVTLDGPSGLDVDDLAQFATALESALLAQVSPVDALTYLKGVKTGADVTTLKAALKADLQAALTQVIANPNLLVSQMLRFYAPNPPDVTTFTEAIADSYLALTNAFDPAMAAHSSLIKGLVRSEMEFSTVSANSGREQTPSLSLLGTTIPGSLVKWTVVSGASVISESGGKFVLSASASANTDYTATVQAKDALFDELLAERQITMRYTQTVVDPGGSVGGAPSTPPVTVPVDRPAVVESTTGAINTAKEQIANAAPEEKARVIAQAVKQVQESVKQMATLDLSGAVTVTGGRAAVTVNADAIREQIAAIQEQVAQLNEALRELDPNAAVTPTLTLNLGNVNAAAVSVPVSKDILDAAKSAGIGTITIQANGVGIGFNPSVFNESTTLDIQTLPDSAATQVTDRPLASSVYDFTFTSADGEIEQFDKPVEIQIPLNEGPYDEDFLTVGKIIDGRINYYGGTVDDRAIRVNRTSFSAYTVIENKVEFNDTAVVRNWAGRQIQVVAAKGIVEGRGEGQYDPNAYVTRAEFAKMISKTLGIDGGTASESFADVNDSDWFQPYVAAVQKWGITNGRTNTQFAPNERITRAEMATMIARALEQVRDVKSFASSADILAKFADADHIHDTLKAGVAFSADQGIVIGQPDNTFLPNSLTTRAEAAVMIYRVLNLQ